MFILFLSVVFNSLILGSVVYFIYMLGAALLFLSFPHTSTTMFYYLGVLVTVTSTLLALSPIGNLLVQVFIGGRELTIREEQVLKPAITAVMEKIKLTCKLDDNKKLDNIKWRIKESFEANAETLGKNTIIVTTGLLNTLNIEEIEAVIAHEFAHILNNDSQILLAIIASNLSTTICMWLIQVGKSLFKALASLFGGILGKSASLLVLSLMATIWIIFLPVVVVNYIGTHILNLMLLTINRTREYEADAFVAKLGLETGLISFLEQLTEVTIHDSNFLSRIFASHPSPRLRLNRLDQIVKERG
jgi:Zn-dependent protease with chaperone function